MAHNLNHDLLKLILQHLPQSDCLRAALVNSNWHQAACAAASVLCISLKRDTPARKQRRLADSAESYLEHHGRHATSLTMQWPDRLLAELPCARLASLDINSVAYNTWPRLQLGPRDGRSGVLGSCAAGLTSLKLSNCTIALASDLLSLSELVSLQVLDVSSVINASEEFVVLPDCVLPSLQQQLTCLRLRSVGGVDGVELGRLGLSVLELCDIRDPANDTLWLKTLPATLREIELGGDVALDPLSLASAPQLRVIDLDYSMIRPQVGMSGGVALLSGVAGLSHLESLSLSTLTPEVEWPPTSAAYTALSASSKLQRLEVRDCGLPAGVWDCVWSRSSCLPEMHSFQMSESDLVDGSSMSVEAVLGLARVCPSLSDLEITLSQASAVAALQSLPALTYLDVSLAADSRQSMNDCMQQICGLTALRCLELHQGGRELLEPNVSALLLPLTGLRQLTRLLVYGGPTEWLSSWNHADKVRMWEGVASQCLSCLILWWEWREQQQLTCLRAEPSAALFFVCLPAGG